jgi:hypothetical protein
MISLTWENRYQEEQSHLAYVPTTELEIIFMVDKVTCPVLHSECENYQEH